MNGKEPVTMGWDELSSSISALNSKVVQLQRAKQREKLPELQKQLHEMRLEFKRRTDAAKKAKHNENQ